MPQQLVLEEVTAGHGRVEVLHGVSMSVPRAGVAALLGPNGVGKTTTLSAIAGTVPVRRGRVLLDGRPINRLSPNERARAGVTLIPEGRGIFPGLSVKDNLTVAGTSAAGAVPATTQAVNLERVLHLFPRLKERARQRAGTLSGGEQQMLALSRALLGGPRVLLLDEISMGLAPQVVNQLFDAVAQLREDGLTILLVEQHLRYALRLADVCYVLARGKVVFVGEPDELRRTDHLPGYVT